LSDSESPRRKARKRSNEVEKLEFDHPGRKSLSAHLLNERVAEWECSRCTLHNPKTDLKCTACGTLRPRDTKLIEQEATWLCTCSIRNLLDTEMCKGCGRLRPILAGISESGGVSASLMCGVCDRAFDSKSGLANHLRSVPHLQRVEQFAAIIDEADTSPAKKPRVSVIPEDLTTETQRFAHAVSVASNASTAWTDFIKSDKSVPVSDRDCAAVTSDDPVTPDDPGGSTRPDAYRAQDVLAELMDDRHSAYSWPFLTPVDVDALGLTDYLYVIKTPMDLGTVGQRLERGEYPATDQGQGQCIADIELVFENCHTYNSATAHVVKFANKLYRVFHKEKSKLPATVRTVLAELQVQKSKVVFPRVAERTRRQPKPPQRFEAGPASGRVTSRTSSGEVQRETKAVQRETKAARWAEPEHAHATCKICSRKVDRGPQCQTCNCVFHMQCLSEAFRASALADKSEWKQCPGCFLASADTSLCKCGSTKHRTPASRECPLHVKNSTRPSATRRQPVTELAARSTSGSDAAQSHEFASVVTEQDLSEIAATYNKILKGVQVSDWSGLQVGNLSAAQLLDFPVDAFLKTNKAAIYRPATDSTTKATALEDMVIDNQATVMHLQKQIRQAASAILSAQPTTATAPSAVDVEPSDK
jgi:hypothetical protein